MPSRSESLSAQVAFTDTGWEARDLALSFFADRGFRVGTPVGHSFSITASPEHFERVFGVKIDPAQLPSELPIDYLDRSITASIQAVIFTRGPDFGPGGNY